jgi:hypothetical protein
MWLLRILGHIVEDVHCLIDSLSPLYYDLNIRVYL